MKQLLKKSMKYTYMVVMPILATALIVNLKKTSVEEKTTAIFQTESKRTFQKNATADEFDGLPCGFVAHGKQLPEKPTFVTNNYIPILQYPAGIFAGTNTQVYDSIFSDHQNDELVLQVDGNLVIYNISNNQKKPIWSANTQGKDGKYLFFQADGDLVLRNTQGKVVWHSNIKSTCAGSELAYFTLQDDGNLAMLYNDNANAVAYYLGGTASTNDQAKMVHPGKLQ